MDKRTFISKVYTQAPDDFLERFTSIDFTNLSDNDKLQAIISTVKNLENEDLEWFSFWYIE